MTDADRTFLNRINKYAEEALKDIDPQNTHVSEQLEKLRPVMEELSKEMGLPIEDVFIKYMDLASEQGVEAESHDTALSPFFIMISLSSGALSALGLSGVTHTNRDAYPLMLSSILL